MPMPIALPLPLVDDVRRPVRVAARVAFAGLSAGAGLAAVAVLEPILSRPYYFPAFAAIVLAAIVAGGRAGVLTTLSFGAGYGIWYLAPRGSLAVKNEAELLALAAYSITGCVVSGLGGALRTAYARMRQQHVELDRIHHQREDLLRALTHDVRTPLGVIATNAALLAQTVGDAATGRRTRLIGRSVQVIDAMLRDLVETAALESGQVALRHAEIDVRSMLATLKDRVGGPVAGDRIHVAVAGELPRLRADPERLERVLVNLVSNALKYSPGRVTLGAHPRDGSVLLSVSDDGPGIAPAELPRIFEKYYRAEATRAGQEGLGLGLYISRLLVEAHGGRIWVESEPGKGSTFHVALPAA